MEAKDFFNEQEFLTSSKLPKERRIYTYFDLIAFANIYHISEVEKLNLPVVMAILPSDKEIEAEASSYDNSMSSIAEGVWMPEGVRAGVKWVKHYMLKKVIGN